MIGIVIGIAAQAAFASAPLARVNPHANELFELDPQLKAWAIRLYDRNQDGWLTIYEAQPAFNEFRAIADANRDGRVTTDEYARAREFVVARW